MLRSTVSIAPGLRLPGVRRDEVRDGKVNHSGDVAMKLVRDSIKR